MADAVLAVLDAGGGARLADPDAPVVRADDLAVTRGEAVFETLRAYAGRAFLLDEHLARMRRSAARLSLRLPGPGEWRHLVGVALSGYGDGDGVLRLICTKGVEGGGGQVGFAHVTPMPRATEAAREHGVAAITLTSGVPAALRPGAPWLLGGVKSTSYAVAMASLRRAAELGADDVVWVSCDGEVLEAPTATVALVRGGRLVTPRVEEVGTLRGTTVAAVAVLAGRVEERRVPVDELRAAEEAMLLSSTRGVAPLRRLDGRPVGDGSVGPLTARLRDAFEAAVRRGALPGRPAGPRGPNPFAGPPRAT